MFVRGQRAEDEAAVAAASENRTRRCSSAALAWCPLLKWLRHFRGVEKLAEQLSPAHSMSVVHDHDVWLQRSDGGRAGGAGFCVLSSVCVPGALRRAGASPPRSRPLMVAWGRALGTGRGAWQRTLGGGGGLDYPRP